MRIIKEGKKPSEKEYEFTCRLCGTIFIAFRGECEFEHDQRDGDFLLYVCPVCSTPCTTDVDCEI
jgi:hypothetical protein